MAFKTSSEWTARVALCIEPYFSLRMHVKSELAHRLQTSKMRRNLTFFALLGGATYHRQGHGDRG